MRGKVETEIRGMNERDDEIIEAGLKSVLCTLTEAILYSMFNKSQQIKVG